MFPAPQIAPPAPREQLLTARQVAEWLSMSHMFVLKHSGPRAQQPAIPSVLLGSRRRYRAEDIERFIADQVSAAKTQLDAAAKRRGRRAA